MGLFKFTVDVEGPSFEEEDVVTGITLNANHILVLVDARSAVTITLPTAASSEGVVYIFKKIDSSGNSVTIDGNGSEKIDGEFTIVLRLQYDYVTIACDGSVWHIIGGGNVKLTDLLDKRLTEEIDLLRKILTEARQVKLHQAKLSNANISEKDAED